MAKEESLKSSFRYKVGAVIVSGGCVLSKGYNKIRHCKIGKRYTNWENSVHAERDACVKIDQEHLVGAELFIFREHKDGSIALAKPCESCMSLIVSKGIKKVYYSKPEYPFYGIMKF